jgi:phage head maturation protease
MSRIIAPKGWNANKIEHRFLPSTPLSYNADDHSCECVISAGATVDRVYGKEILLISQSACDLSLIPVPLLDSHSQASVIDSTLGRIERAWVSAGKLHGKIIFAQTSRGKVAEGMVSRGEVTGISAGYAVKEWQVTDADGDVVDDDQNVSWDDDLTFTATRWMLYEASLVGVPADLASAIRSHGGGDSANDARVRAEVRERMQIRQNMYDAAQAVSDRLH